MLNNTELEMKARKYLLDKDYPISELFNITLPGAHDSVEVNDYLKSNNLASIAFKSCKPENDLIPSIFIAYVNIDSGEVHVPRHM